MPGQETMSGDMFVEEVMGRLHGDLDEAMLTGESTVAYSEENMRGGVGGRGNE